MTGPAIRADYVSANRGRVRDSYILICPENLVENSLPHLRGVNAQPLATPRALPARFGEYLLDFEPGAGTTRPIGAGFENFLYVLEGELRVRAADDGYPIKAGGYLFLPQGVEFEVDAAGTARALWVKRRYEAVDGVAAPEIVAGHVDEVEHIPDETIGGTYAPLLPLDERYDMAMNVMRFDLGARFTMVEVHHQEHGLYMLEGQGVYYLGEDHVEVAAGDFVYMAPYCPQYFYATGSANAAYLLYKDINRDGF
ncbi:(S)-ureidoglycine aminohydrolase [Microtetraspora niveoalba]|uniref:(S)-ureidoglycine aminohydrolase n=1 Tax=Microtetraspora niveoalba TaxID=46175 RepID=UPI0008322642|nr:(S)-ureidoglycine aminohydrolase [Microtetraspora niveoalba]